MKLIPEKELNYLEIHSLRVRKGDKKHSECVWGSAECPEIFSSFG